MQLLTIRSARSSDTVTVVVKPSTSYETFLAHVAEGFGEPALAEAQRCDVRVVDAEGNS